MELSARKQAILSAVVKTHIQTGEPIGSKLLSNILNLSLSAATLRNEMSELCDLGLLKQPHTSAGRVPSVMGYKMYVSSLMKHSPILDEQKAEIDNLLSKLPDDPQYIQSIGAQLLADFTSLAAISATSLKDTAFIKYIEVVPVSRKSLLLVLITSDGVSQNRLCRSEFDLSADDLTLLKQILNKHLISKRLSQFDKIYLQNIFSSCDFSAIQLMPIISDVFDTINEIAKPKLELKGKANLFGKYFSDNDALKIIKMLSNTESVISLFQSLSDPINVIFADSSDIDLEHPPCMIIANYPLGKTSAQIGVIGPARMSYENIIPSIEYFAKGLSKKMNTALNAMED